MTSPSDSATKTRPLPGSASNFRTARRTVLGSSLRPSDSHALPRVERTRAASSPSMAGRTRTMGRGADEREEREAAEDRGALRPPEERGGRGLFAGTMAARTPKSKSWPSERGRRKGRVSDARLERMGKTHEKKSKGRRKSGKKGEGDLLCD